MDDSGNDNIQNLCPPFTDCIIQKLMEFPQSSSKDKNFCKGVFTEAECLNAFQKLKYGKTSLLDGLPADFHIFL